MRSADPEGQTPVQPSRLRVNLAAFLDVFARYFFDALLQSFLLGDALLRRTTGHVLGDVHRAEVRVAHARREAAPMGAYVLFLGDGDEVSQVAEFHSLISLSF